MTSTRPRRPTRSLIIPDDVWWPAQEQAVRDRTSVNAVVVELLRGYGTAEVPLPLALAAAGSPPSEG